MGWETRGNGSYYYRKRRDGNRVVSEYIGAGDWADVIALIDDQKHYERDVERAEFHAEREYFADVDKLIGRIEFITRTLTRATLQTSGFHRYKGQWRRKSG